MRTENRNSHFISIGNKPEEEEKNSNKFILSALKRKKDTRPQPFEAVENAVDILVYIIYKSATSTFQR